MMIMFCSSPQLRPTGNAVGIAWRGKVCIGNAATATDDFLQHGPHLPRVAKVVLRRQFQVEAFAWHSNCCQSRRQSCTARKELCCTNPAGRLRLLRVDGRRAGTSGSTSLSVRLSRRSRSMVLVSTSVRQSISLNLNQSQAWLQK